MKPKHTLTLALMVIIIGAAIFITSRSDYTQSKKEVPSAIASLAEVAADKVREIKLAKGGQELVISRADGSWSVPAAWGHPADGKKIDTFLAGIKALGEAEERATNAANHADFDVDDEKGCRVELVGEGSGLPARFTIGKSDGFERCFLRVGGESSVYSVRPNLIGKANLYGSEVKAKDWLDLTVFEPSADAKLSELILTTKDGTIHLVRREAPKVEGPPAEAGTGDGGGAGEGAGTGEAASRPAAEIAAVKPPAPKSDAEPVWDVIAPETFEAEASAARSVTSRAMRLLRGEDVVDPARSAEYGLDPPERQVVMAFAGGARVEIRFGSEITEEKDGEKKGTGRFYMQRAGDSRVFTTQTWARDGYFKTLSELKPLPPKKEESAEDAKGVDAEKPAEPGVVPIPEHSAEPAPPPEENEDLEDENPKDEKE